MHQPPFICAALFLVSDLFKRHPALKLSVSQPETRRRMLAAPTGRTPATKVDDDDDDEIERFVDKDDEEEDAASGEKAAAAPVGGYNAAHLDPRYARADETCLWELVPLAQHYHPTVALYARLLLQGETIKTDRPAADGKRASVAATQAEDVPFKGAPNMHSFSLAAFLDRFVFKNAKTGGGGAKEDGDSMGTAPSRGASLMQPHAMGGVGAADGAIVSWMRNKKLAQHLTEKQLLGTTAERLPVDEQFFHKFYSLKHARAAAAKGRKKSKKGSDDEDDEEEDDGRQTNDATGLAAALDGGDEELGEKEVWDAMVRSMPEFRGAEADDDDDDDDDDDLADMDDDDDDEDGDDDGFGGDDGSDDGEMMFPDSESEEDEPAPAPVAARGKKRKGGATADKSEQESGGGGKRRKREKLPMLGSYEDYAKYVDDDAGLDD